MPKAVASVLELLGKVTELPFCLFVLSLVLLADTDSAIMGVAFSFESLSQVSLPHWIGFGVLVFLFYSLVSRAARVVVMALIGDKARRWIDRFLDSPFKRADDADAAQNKVDTDRLLLLALLRDNKSAMALVEQHRKAESEQQRIELTYQHHAFCFLLALLVDVVAQGPLLQAVWSRFLSGDGAFRMVAGLFFFGILFAGLYLGIIRDRAERRDSTIWLPGHELLELPVIPRPESARQAVAREGGPKPSRAAIASNGPAAFP